MRQFFTLIILPVLAIVGGCGKSGYAHCVFVQDESAFIGEWLKNSGAEIDSVVKTEECVALEKTVAESDGSRAGRVRWVECPVGPDCDESGKF